MLDTLAVVTSHERWTVGLMVSTFGFGLRHGIDWDHIAAITDITSSQDDRRRSMLFASLYALGHASVLLLLGSLAIFAGDLLPARVDSMMERAIGVTLLLLGSYVFYSLVRHGRDFRMRSRWMLIFAGFARLAHRVRHRPKSVEIVHDHHHVHHSPHDHPHGHIAEGSAARRGESATDVLTRHRHTHRHRGSMPHDPFTSYGKVTSYAVGMLHGVGAETASQVLVFLAAARAGNGLGEVLLVVFILGLVTSNTAIALASTFGYLNAARSFRVYVTVAAATAAFSLAIGTLFILGKAISLPAIFGG